MIPYLVIYPFWILASIVWPLFQSLNALHGKGKDSSREMKVWLFYWVLYAVVSCLFALPGFETIVYMPFAILDIFISLYYEVQLGAVVFLVNPRVRGLDIVLQYAETNIEPYWEGIKGIVDKLLDQAMAAVGPLLEQAGLMPPKDQPRM